MNPWIVSFVFGTLGESLMSAWPIIALILTSWYKLGVSGFVILSVTLLVTEMIALLIDAGYGLDRKHGWVRAIRKLCRLRNDRDLTSR